MGLFVRNVRQLSRLLNAARSEDVHWIAVGTCRQLLRKQSTFSSLNRYHKHFVSTQGSRFCSGREVQSLCRPNLQQNAQVFCSAFFFRSKSTQSESPVETLSSNISPQNASSAASGASSQTGVETDISLPEGYIPEPPSMSTPSLSELDFNALGEPTLESLGLVHWTPSGLIQMALENLHVAVDLPWWGAIAVCTICIRTLMFPLVIYAQRQAAKTANTMPTVQRLQKKFTEARSSGNPLEAARAGNELAQYMRNNDVNPLKTMVTPMAQVPVFLSVFYGLREMSNLPVASMQTGGMLWFTNLTVPDPFYVLPLMTCATLLVTFEVGTDSASTANMTPVMKWVMRGLPIIFLPITMNFPAAMLCYWLTSNMFSLVQVLFLRIPGVREFFKIPVRVIHKKLPNEAPKQPFMDSFRDTWSNSKVVANLEERQRQDATKFRQSGKGPIPKTYTYNPKKVKPTVKLQAKSKSG